MTFFDQCSNGHNFLSLENLFQLLEWSTNYFEQFLLKSLNYPTKVATLYYLLRFFSQAYIILHKRFMKYNLCNLADLTAPKIWRMIDWSKQGVRFRSIQQIRGPNFTQFWSPTPCEWTLFRDILHDTYPLFTWPWTFYWPPTPFSCPRSYWMPPLRRRKDKEVIQA